MRTFKEGSASARVVADSIRRGSRLTSIEVEFPRPFLAEFNTHCRLSRNSASSRAIPVWKRLVAVLERPYIPNSFGMNKGGMQAGEELSSSDREAVVKNWLFGRDMAVAQAYSLIGGRKEILATLKDADDVASAERMCDTIEKLIAEYSLQKQLSSQDKGLHKQHANRVLETYSFHTVIATATHWKNFFVLRASGMAQPEAQDFAIAMARAMMNSTPQELSLGYWHLPYISDDDRAEEKDQRILANASAGKCARTSYLTQDGIRSLGEDLKLYQRLMLGGHMSPLQHQARPREARDLPGLHGNYSREWVQLRKLIPHEGDFSHHTSPEDLLTGCRGDLKIANFVRSLAA